MFDVDFKTYSFQTHCNLAFHVLIDRHSLEVFVGRPSDYSVIYGGAVTFDQGRNRVYVRLSIPMLQALSHDSNLALLCRGAQRNFIRTVALTL